MDANLDDILRFGLIAAVLGGLLWTGYVVRQHYEGGKQPVRFRRMMRRLGLDPRSMESPVYGDHIPTAGRLCRRCRSKAECDAWLRVKTQATCLPPDFCPNAAYLRLLLHETEGLA